MSRRQTHRDAATGRIHAVELRRGDRTWDLAILESSDAGDLVEVWRGGFEDRLVATAVFRVMSAWPARWSVWSDMSRLLGPEFVLGLIRAESASAAEASLVQARKDAEQANRRRERGSIRLELWLPKGRSFITAVRGGRQFMCLQTHGEVQALRLWDWVRWQAVSFDQWYDVVQTHGQDVLAGRIIDWMLADERRLIASGLSPGGHRPLRYWRPRRWSRRARTGDDVGDQDQGGPSSDPKGGGC